VICRPTSRNWTIASGADATPVAMRSAKPRTLELGEVLINAMVRAESAPALPRPPPSNCCRKRLVLLGTPMRLQQGGPGPGGQSNS